MIKCAMTALSIPGKCLLCALQTRVSDTSRETREKSVFGLHFHPAYDGIIKFFTELWGFGCCGLAEFVNLIANARAL